MTTKEKISPPRIAFLKEARQERGASAVEQYPPAKWAIEKGYVRLVEGRWGGRQHFITPEGEEALKIAGIT